MKKALLFTIAGAASLTLATMCSCGGPKGPEAPEILAAYIEQPAQPQAFAQSAAYFDLSDGMLAAYKDPATMSNLKSIVNKLTGDKSIKFYALKDGKIADIETEDATKTYNYIMNPTSYRTIAPIEEALKQITSSNESALLITDYEEYKNGKIQHENYAQKYFTKWLNAGNDITFFVIDYTEGKTEKHLYFTVFDSPAHGLLSQIEGALKGNDVNYVRFNLNNNAITYTTDYLTSIQGGAYHNKKGQDVVSGCVETGVGNCFTLFEGRNAEYYYFEEAWKDIPRNAKDYKEIDPADDNVYTALISGLTIDFTGMSGYNVQAIDIDVADIQADYGSYAENFSATQNGDEEVPPYVKAAPKAVKDLFDFTGAVKNNVATIAIDLSPKFSGLAEPTDMLRVDVKIGACDEIQKSKIKELFSWANNESLSDAVFYTLQNCNPTGKVLYTYYIAGN